MNAPLLTTKLFAPIIRREIVPRPRLTEQLDMGLQRKLTLISAPAGFGKTTLVAEWLTAIPDPVTWFSLDQTDNDPARFFTYLVAALQKVDPAIGKTAQTMLQAPQPPAPEALLTALINDIAVTPTPFVLVIDDYHVIQTLAIHQQLTFLLEHLPPQMHLVLVSREDPPFPLSRLRARGQMTDIRQTDLRFTEEETRDFAQRVMQVGLSLDDIAILHACTEGWVTGLQFAALSMQQHSDVHRLLQSLTGDNRYILDYLMDEVFQRQPAEVQDFLLRTSVLERFSAPLCDAITGQKESNEILLALEHANLFIVPLDEVRHWYRYHHLFADLLRHRLESESEDRMAINALHRKASQWYAANGFPADAIHHALDGADWKAATNLILSLSSSLMKRGEVITLLWWFQRFPVEVIRANPRLCQEQSWALILTEQFEAAESIMTLAAQGAPTLGDRETHFRGGLATARAHIARARGNMPHVIEYSEQALALLPQDDLGSRSIVALNLGITQWYRGNLVEAEKALREAERAGRLSRNDYAHWAALVFLGRIQVAHGHLHKGIEFCRQVIEQGGTSMIVGPAHYDVGRLLYEWNDLAAAAGHLQQGIELSERGGSVEFQIGGYGSLALVKQAQGETAAAKALVDKVSQLLQTVDIPAPTRVNSTVWCALVMLAQGEAATAARMLAPFSRPEEVRSMVDYLLLLYAQAVVYLAQGQRAEAAERLGALQHMAGSLGWHSMLVRAHALHAVMASTQEAARAALTEALTLAEPEGYIRTFVDLGEPMQLLLADYSVQTVERGEYVDRLLGAFEIPIAQPETQTEASKSKLQNLNSTMIEPLSDREIDVLHLLADGLTNPEIALTMHVSVNTVKTHLKNIYDKVGVHRRREVIARAKALGI